MRRKNVLRRDVPAPTIFQGMATTSAEMVTFFTLVERVARTSAPVLIRGETGTGKGLVARALHALGARPLRPFAALRCRAFPAASIDDEIFGHERNGPGARPPLLRRADGGTVYLAEIAATPPDTQARLLHLLAERSFFPRGAVQPVAADVRFVSSTSCSLLQLVQDQRFSAELFYRLGVVRLTVPALRERAGDVDALAWVFVDHFNARGERQVEAIEEDALDALRSYPFPGNVRELRNALEHAFAVGDGDTVLLEDLPAEVRGDAEEPSAKTAATNGTEYDRIAEALRRTRGRKAAAAALLGMSRSTLWRKMREYGLTAIFAG